VSSVRQSLTKEKIHTSEYVKIADLKNQDQNQNQRNVQLQNPVIISKGIADSVKKNLQLKTSQHMLLTEQNNTVQILADKSFTIYPNQSRQQKNRLKNYITV
jgi:hypothetical protein